MCNMETVLYEEKTSLVHPHPFLPFFLHSFPDLFLLLCFLFRPHLPPPFLLQLLIPRADPRNRALGVRKGIGHGGLDG